MALSNQYLEVAFGAGYTGLATVGYALKDSAGGDVVARETTTGVIEQAGGTYGVVAPTIANSVATVEWDTGGGSPIYAHEDVGSILRRVVEHVDADVSSRSDFDETADPVELLDSGGGAGTSAAELVVDTEAWLASNHGSGAWDGTEADWTTGEKEQIREALGVDGDKTTATGGLMQKLLTLAKFIGLK